MITPKLQIERRKFNPVKNYLTVKREAKKRGYKTSKEELKKIWEKSLEIIKERLLEGEEIKLRGNIGTLGIYQKNVSDMGEMIKQTIINNTKEFNHRTGKHHFFGLQPTENMHEKLKFKPSPELKKRLKEKLKTEIQYKPAPLKFY